jgi:hypothetical protein
MSDNMTRLTRVLGMLGSEYDGEVLNAARMAERIRRDINKPWGELLTPSSAGSNNDAHYLGRALRAEARVGGLEARVLELENTIRTMQAAAGASARPSSSYTRRRSGPGRVRDKYYLSPEVEDELVKALQEKWSSHHRIYAITNWPRAWLKVQLEKIAQRRRLTLQTRDAMYGKGFIYRFV